MEKLTNVRAEQKTPSLLSFQLSLSELKEAAKEINQRFDLKAEKQHWDEEANELVDSLHQ